MATLTPNKDMEVTVSQQGDLKLIETDTIFGGTGEKYARFEVPAGKKWLVKTLWYTYTGTYTATNRKLRIWNVADAIGISIEDYTTETVITKLLGEQDVLIPAGWTVGLSTSISADTNGRVYVRMLYVEMDA